MTTTAFELLLVGFGHVAQRFVALLEEQRTALSDRGVAARVVGIVTRRHGRVSAPEGVDAVSLAATVERGESIGGAHDARPVGQFIANVASRSAAAADGRLVVMETTALDIMDGHPAIDHVRLGLMYGAHVITTNKGPVAFAYRQLARAAAQAGRRFLFEGTVMDGIPVFNLFRETLPTVTVRGFRGVVNSTTNHILTEMERGVAFDVALRAMQEAGIAEADPSLDVDGWDAAAKTAAIVNVLLDGELTPQAVARKGLCSDSGDRAQEALTRGRRLKLVAKASREKDVISASVGLEELSRDDLLACLEGQQNAIVFDTDPLGEIAIVQCGGGLTQTAYALLSDLVAIRKNATSGGPFRAAEAD